jgi:hypothetical protein
VLRRHQENLGLRTIVIASPAAVDRHDLSPARQLDLGIPGRLAHPGP